MPNTTSRSTLHSFLFLSMFFGTCFFAGQAVAADHSNQEVKPANIQLERSIPVGDVDAIAVDSAHNLLVEAYLNGRIDLADLTTGGQLKSVTLSKPFPSDPSKQTSLFQTAEALTVDERHNRVFLLDGAEDAHHAKRIDVIDEKTLAAVATIDSFEDKPLQNINAIGIDPEKNHLIVASADGFLLFDLSPLRYVSTVAMDPLDPLFDVQSPDKYYKSFLTFDPAHRTFYLRASLRSAEPDYNNRLAWRKGLPDYKACVAIFSIDTGKRVGTLGACKPAETLPGPASGQPFPWFSVIKAATVDTTSGVVVFGELTYTPDAYATRLRLFDSTTLQYIKSENDPALFGSKNMAAGKNVLYVVSGDEPPSEAQFIRIYSLKENHNHE